MEEKKDNDVLHLFGEPISSQEDLLPTTTETMVCEECNESNIFEDTKRYSIGCCALCNINNVIILSKCKHCCICIACFNKHVNFNELPVVLKSSTEYTCKITCLICNETDTFDITQINKLYMFGNCSICNAENISILLNCKHPITCSMCSNKTSIM